jgi:hypothetical protein
MMWRLKIRRGGRYLFKNKIKDKRKKKCKN